MLWGEMNEMNVSSESLLELINGSKVVILWLYVPLYWLIIF